MLESDRILDDQTTSILMILYWKTIHRRRSLIDHLPKLPEAERENSYTFRPKQGGMPQDDNR